MQRLFGSLFAIIVASVAAIAATSAMLNMPTQLAPAHATPVAQTPEAAPPQSAPPASEPRGAKPATPPASSTAAPASGGAAAAAGAGSDTKDDEPDKDPYEGINPEELPPDLQYNADSSVSFPTNI